MRKAAPILTVVTVVAGSVAGALAISPTAAGASTGPFTPSIVTTTSQTHAICRANGGSLSANSEADQDLGFTVTAPNAVTPGQSFDIKIKQPFSGFPSSDSSTGISATIVAVYNQISKFKLPAGMTVNSVSLSPIDGNTAANPDAGYYVAPANVPQVNGAPDPNFDPLSIPASQRVAIPGTAPAAFVDSVNNVVRFGMLGAGTESAGTQYAGGSIVQAPSVTLHVTANPSVAAGTDLGIKMGGTLVAGSFTGSQPGNFPAPAAITVNQANATSSDTVWTDPSYVNYVYTTALGGLVKIVAKAACGPGFEVTGSFPTAPAYYTGPNAIPNGTAPLLNHTTVIGIGSTAPVDGASYITGSVVPASYQCIANAQGESYDTCVGDLPSGTNLDTTTPGPHSFTISATDAFQDPITRTINYTVADPLAPVANAGAAQTAKVAGNVVTLDGSGTTDPNGPPALPLTYTWAQTSGNAVTLSDAHAVKPTFTVPPADNGAGDTYGFSLTVDNGYLTNTSSTTVSENASTPTVAVTKARSGGTCTNFCTGDLVTLSAAITNPDGNSSADYTYAWSQTGGRITALSSTSVSNPTYNVPSSGAAPTTAVCTSGGALTTPTATSANCPTYSVVVTKNTTGKSSVQANLAVYGSTLPTRPVANAGTAFTRGPGKAAALNGTASTQANGHVISYAWTQTAGDPVTLSSNTVASPTFTTPVNPQTLTFSLVVTDTQSPILGSGTNGQTSTASTVNVTVSADKVVADAGLDQTGKVAGNTVTLTGAASTDPNGLPLNYTWQQLTGPTVTLSNPNVVSPTFVVPAVDNPTGYTWTFTVTATNGGPNPTDTDTDATPVTITAIPSTPTVAAPTKARSGGTCTNFCIGDLVTLSAAITNPDGTAPADYTYVWVQSGGRTTALSDAGAAHPTYILPPSGVAPGNAAVCTSGAGAVGPTSANCPTYKVTVTKVNTTKASAQSGALANYSSTLATRPVANAGADQTPSVNQVVTLAGVGTQANAHALSYAWTQTGGTAVTLSDPTAAQPTFTAPAAAGALTFSLVVTDTQNGVVGAGTGGNTSLADSVTVNVLAAAPVANAGADQSVKTSTAVTLHGSATQADNDALSYAWTQTGGASVSLSDATAAEPTFTAPAAADSLTFSLVATDTVTGIASAPATVTITVSLPDAPVANAGTDQAVQSSTTATLHGSGTQTDNDPLTYAWTQTDGTSVTLSDATAAEPTFTTPASAGTVTFSLIVTDTTTGIASASDTVTITVSLPDAPVANAGTDQSVDASSVVTLHGSGTQTDNHALSYAWTQVGGTTVTLSDATAAEPTFTAPPTTEEMTFSLVVTDTVSGIASPADEVTVSVSLPDRPVANAGADQNVGISQPVTLHGTGTQSDDHILSYAWTQTGGTAVTLSDATAAEPTFTAPGTAGALTFSLVVTDTESAVVGNNTSLADSVTVNVSLPSITGTVTDASSAPIAGATVYAFAPADVITPTASTTTGADGTYALSVAPGTYDVAVTGPSGSDYLTQWYNGVAGRSSATHVFVSDTDVSGISFQLAVGGSISGTVKDASAQPLGGVTVYGFAPGDTFIATATATTAADGTYVLHALPATTFDVAFAPPAHTDFVTQWYNHAASRAGATGLVITGANTIASVDAQFATAGAISGVVTKAGGDPVAGVVVRVLAPTDTYVATASATTAANGSYTIHGLAAGTYKVYLAPPAASGLSAEWFNNALTRATGTNVNVTAGGTTTVSEQLSAATTISGVVHDSHGNPVAGATVKVFAPADLFAASYGTTTGADGTYSVVVPAPAAYKVNFSASGFVGQWYNAAATRAAATAVNAVGGVPQTGISANLASTP